MTVIRRRKAIAHPTVALHIQAVTANFAEDIKFVRQEEGGNDNDPYDPGGRTSRGIEQSEWDAWCKLYGLPKSDVWKAPDEDINEIYFDQYWDPYTDLVPWGIQLVFFDTHVNEGLGPAVRFLQNALEVPADGKFGIITRSHAADITDPAAIVRDMTAQRRSAYRGMSRFWRFGKGWLARAAACEATALAQIKAGPPKPPEATPAPPAAPAKAGAGTPASGAKT